MPNAVVRDFRPRPCGPGDVFLMNDTYLTEGSIGHLPDLCSTVPVFHAGEVVAYIQAFGHHDDIGGRVPGSMPGTATTVFEEGLAIPPIKLYDAGVRNEAVFTIVKRNTRVPEMPRRRSRQRGQGLRDGRPSHGGTVCALRCDTVEACFQAILDKCRDIYRRELLPKIADGEYSWADYVEHDGVTDPKLHKLALKMIKQGERITLDLHGHRSAVDRSDQLAGGLCRRRVSHQWDRADPAQSRRHARARGRNPRQRGVCEVFDIVFPPKGTLITPEWPAATMRARSCCCAASGCSRAVVAQARRLAGMPCRPGDHPLYRVLRPRPRRQAVPVA